LGTYCGTNSPGTIASTHQTGALTFVFHSDYSVTQTGWEATISCINDPVKLDLKVYLEGPFNGENMNTDLNNQGLIPLDQPYTISPWNYNGSESVVTIPNPDVVDWVLIELRDAAEASLAAEETTIARRAVLLLKDGSIKSLDGTSVVDINVGFIHQLFVIIRHRNHLDVMSALPLTESGGLYTYDFTTTAVQAYGSLAQKNIGGGNFGMYSGDALPDGVLNDEDGTASWYLETGQFGYLNSDVDLNGQSNNQDKNDFWYINQGSHSQTP
jgi:hypothetical protein